MADKNNVKMAQGLAALGRKKKKKTLKEKEFENYKTALDTKYDKMSRIQKIYEGTSPKIKADLKNKFKDSFKPGETINAVRRETKRTESAKGGRMGYKGGGMSQRGLGRAFMKGGKV